MHQRRLLLAHYGAWKRHQVAIVGKAFEGTAPGESTLYGYARRGYNWSIPYGSMTFTRSSQGSYYTQAPTTGASSFLSVASNDVLRTDNRGDGAGGLTLLEGARTNSILYARQLSNQTYWTHNGGTHTSDQGTGPDGASSADRANLLINQNAFIQSLGVGVFSAFGRGYSGTSAWQMGIDGVAYTGTTSISTTWQRRSVYTGSAVSYYLPIDSNNRTGSGGIAASAMDVLIDYIQFEASVRFPSTPMPTSGSTFTRAADTLTLTSGSVPAGLLHGPGRFTQISPLFANTDLVSGDEMWLLSLGGSSNGIRIRHNGTDVRVEAVEGGTVRAQSNALTFSRDALLGIVAWNPETGIVSVNGSNGPTGTLWVWAAANLRVGGIHSASGEAFCRFGTLESY